ncbi:TAXI family TRAP transporter solute-binding subunit [Pseudalkalibacillus decolorationis]|uniref:TAXI family TRAP transporter solute-binding subunit n=1 Tax=Pseudalkalibacillus decolorationis TaxID=163879 RepID=UPI00214798EA|nr:TAXI family TRAP transporter solute-binding subunit [Pseudalkalibacillus decolorationis]
MRKVITVCLISMLLMIMTACGSESASGDGEGGLEAPDKFLKVGSGPMGSGWYPITTILSELYMDKFSGLNVSQIEGGSTANLKALQIGDIKYGIHYTSDYADALKGSGSFDKELDQVAGLGSLYPVYQTIATLAENEEINKVEDIVDKHIFLGPKGGGGPVAFWNMMEEYGIDEKTIEDAGGKISYGNYNDGASMLKDGIVDIFVGGGAPQVTALQEIEVTQPVKVIPIDEDKLKSIREKGIGISSDQLPAGTYKGLDEDIPTYTLVAMFSVRKDLEKEYVYNLTKVFWENQKPFEDQLPQRAKYFTLETALDGIDPETLHPGAVKYYKEKGIIE